MGAYSKWNSLRLLIKDRRLWLLGAICYLIFITFPGFYSPIRTGLDPSWAYGLNYLAQSGHIFGRDVVFSYGPLGYLLSPLNIGSNLIFALTLWVIVHSLFAFILIHFLKTKRLLPFLLFIIAYIIISAIGWLWLILYEYHIVLILGLLLCASLEVSKKTYYITLPLAGLLSGLSLFMKLNLGLTALTMIIIYAGICVIKMRKKVWQAVLLSFLPYLLIIACLAKIHFQSYQHFARWIIASFEIVDGYSTAMAVIGSEKILILGVIAIILYITLSLILFKRKTNLFYVALIFLIPVFFFI
ncbi:hypothetical protein ACFLVE_02195 [Chloroflexota bacterium]